MTATTAGSLAIGLGNESPLEVGLAIHHTYGMPLVPGSAIKGLCRAVARQLRDENKMDQNQFDFCFGTTEQESPFVFWDAWYDPASVDGKPFHRDVVTVHHPEYYRKRGNGVWPTDFDDPTPVPFLVVKPDAHFLFAIEGPKEWYGFIGSLLQWALENVGIGGKTNAGYGRFCDVVLPKPEPERVTWPDVEVIRCNQKGATFFTVHTPKCGNVDVTGHRAQEINNKLSPEYRDRLKKKPKFPADVTAEIKGDQVIICSITPLKEG